MSETTRRRDPDATRTAILEAAEELFLEHGLADTPTSRIAKRAGVTKSLIHHHFGSKEDLWNQVKRRHFETYFERQMELFAETEGTENTESLMRRSIVGYFRFLQQNPRSVSFMSWRFVEGEDPCLDLEDQLFEQGIARIEAAQEAGNLRADIDALSMIKAFLAMALQWFQTKDFVSQIFEGRDIQAMEEKYLEDMVTIFFEGVRPKNSPDA